MNSSILNPDFSHPSDGWYQIEPKGEHPNQAAGVIQVIDDDAMKSIVGQFNQDAAAGKLRHGNELLIDHEHFSDQPDKETRAYGWLVELQAREDGVYGRVRWSKTGQEAVDGGDYRFFSTEYAPKDCVECQVASGDGMARAEQGEPNGDMGQDTSLATRHSTLPRVRPLRLDGLTLTNMNNNRGQKPITNRDPSGPADQPPTKIKTMNTVALKLGLATDAPEESILEEVTRLLNRVTELIPHEEENKSLRERLRTFDNDQVHTLLDLHGVREEKIRNRLQPVLITLKSREERVAALLDFGFKPEECRAQERPAPRMLNRGEGRQPRSELMTASEQSLAQKAEAEIGDYKIRNRCSYAEARNAVRTARPELFGLEKK